MDFFIFLVQLLTGPYWLNDQIIAFYFLYLEQHVFKSSSEKFLFVPPAITQLIKMSPAEETKDLLETLNPRNKKKVIFFAVNDNESTHAGGSHWSLLVFSRPELAFFNFDSIPGHNRATTKRIVNLLRLGLNCSTAAYQDQACSQQSNHYDCGIHLLVNAENIANYFLIHESVEDVPQASHTIIANKRANILHLISEMGGNF